MPYESIIFDFDGTLADSLESTRVIFNELAVREGFQTLTQEDLLHLKNCSLKEFLNHLGLSKTKFLLYLIKGRKIMKQRMHEIPLIDGFEQVLPKLRKKIKLLGILTSNSKENVEDFLKIHKLESHFDFISSTHKILGKTRYLKSITRTFSISKKSMLYVGDEIRDIVDSKKAGVDVVGVPWGFNSKESLLKMKPHFMIEHPNDLLKFI